MLLEEIKQLERTKHNVNRAGFAYSETVDTLCKIMIQDRLIQLEPTVLN